MEISYESLSVLKALYDEESCPEAKLDIKSVMDSMEERLVAMESILEETQGLPLGIQLKNENGLYVYISPDHSTTNMARAVYFDASGIVGYSDKGYADDILEDVVSNGFVKRSDEALESMSLAKQWQAINRELASQERRSRHSRQ